jgi:hypothetical protein
MCLLAQVGETVAEVILQTLESRSNIEGKVHSIHSLESTEILLLLRVGRFLWRFAWQRYPGRPRRAKVGGCRRAEAVATISREMGGARRQAAASLGPRQLASARGEEAAADGRASDESAIGYYHGEGSWSPDWTRRWHLRAAAARVRRSSYVRGPLGDVDDGKGGDDDISNSLAAGASCGRVMGMAGFYGGERRRSVVVMVIHIASAGVDK